MLNKGLFLFLLLTFNSNAQNIPYELIMRTSHERVLVGDDVEYLFYVKNNSTENISVPAAKSSARGIDDVLTHQFEVFNKSDEQINKQFKCGVGGRDRRILSGVQVKPGDSALIIKRKFSPTQKGAYKAKYLFDFHPNSGSHPNPSPDSFKKMVLKMTITIDVQGLDFDFQVKQNRISAEEMWKAPILTSLSEALKDPDNVFRIKLDNPTIEEISQISKFKNVQDLYLNGGKVESLPNDLFDLNYRSLNLSLNVGQGISIPKSINKSTGLEVLVLKPVNGLDLSGFEGGEYPKLRSITIMSVYEPMKILLPVHKMPALESFTMYGIKSITFVPTDFSTCTNLKQFNLSSKNIDYGSELILPSLTSLGLAGCRDGKIPNLSKCVKLETLNLLHAKCTEIPSHILEISNLKRITIRKDVSKNDTLKALKKRGVEIDRH